MEPLRPARRRSVPLPRRSHRRALGVLALTGLVLVAPSPARAQTAGDGFLFKEPNGSFGVRGGYSRAAAGSDIFSDAIRHLTLGKSDFSGFSVGADLSVRLTRDLDLVVGGDYTGSSANSEFREFVEVINEGTSEEDSLAIAQATSFRRVPLSVGLKWYLLPRGRSVSSFAWIPNRYAPYLGAGVGAMWYRFRQKGDFVDFETSDIFTEEFASSGWAPMAHGLAGLDYSLGPWFALSLEARYAWARAELDDQAFEGFDKIDLSGPSGTIGFKFRF